jgi:hypothetical protein
MHHTVGENKLAYHTSRTRVHAHFVVWFENKRKLCDIAFIVTHAPSQLDHAFDPLNTHADLIDLRLWAQDFQSRHS